METLLYIPQLRIEVDRSRGMVRIDRTSVPFETIAAYDEMVEAMVRALGALDRPRYTILIDMRPAPLRSGDQFERSALRFRHESTRDFARAAVLVQTQVGRLQLLRHEKENRGGPQIFSDEAEALKYLGARTGEGRPGRG